MSSGISGDEKNKETTDFQDLPSSLQKSIKKIAENENFLDFEVVAKNTNTNGDNYLAMLYEINIKGARGEGTDEIREKEINLFIKKKVILKNVNVFNVEHLYNNEKFIYKELSKVINSLQDQAKLPPEYRLKISKAYDETSNDAIILENLCYKGYRRYEKSEVATLRFYELGVQELAKLHAISFVIENKMPEYFKEKIVTLDNPYKFNDDFFALMRKVCMHIADLYDDETKKTKVKNFVPVLIEKLPKYQYEKSTFCTLSHGDYRKCNCMVRFKDGEEEEIIIIDYQMLDSGCPIRDLLLFIICGFDRDLRRNHLNHLKNLYFQTLTEFLTYFDMDVETVFPRREFDRICTEWMDYALIMTLLFSVFMMTSDVGVDFQNLSLRDLPYQPNPDQEEILRHLLDDYMEWGYL